MCQMSFLFVCIVHGMLHAMLDVIALFLEAGK